MQDIIIELSLYLVIAILLGFTFGWFGAKAMIKENYEALLEVLKQKYPSEVCMIEKQKEALCRYKKINETLVSNNDSTRIEELKKIKSLLISKDEVIKKLTFELSHSENEVLLLKENQDIEMEAFIYERNETLHKYKNLQDQLNQCLRDREVDKYHDSWIRKMFKNSKEKVY